MDTRFNLQLLEPKISRRKIISIAPRVRFLRLTPVAQWISTLQVIGVGENGRLL